MISEQDLLQRYEKGHIRHLQEERLKIQKKTFTRWMNSFIEKDNMRVRDLFRDLADGKILMRFLESMSNEKIGKPNNGMLKIQRIENVNKSLHFLTNKTRLDGIAAEDIVSGNVNLIMALIWITILLYYQMEGEKAGLSGDDKDGVKKSPKDALLLWCQKKTERYENVEIENFTSSWRDGMAFNALLHAHKPDLVNYDKLKPENAEENLKSAFTIAESLGIAPILDAEDVNVEKPDEKSIVTYVSSLYIAFSKLK